MRWFFDEDHFRISKSVMVADLEELVAQLMQMDNVSKPALSALALEDALHHSLDDFEGQKMNPYEADAIEMAIRTGKLPDDLARILHSPDQFPPGSSQFEIAKAEALTIGKKMINEAAQLQNEMNEGIHPKAPLPFMDNGELHPSYQEVVRSSVAKQTGKSRRSRSDTDFNPFSEGKLVTRLVSTYTGGNGKDEGFARWYEPAAKDLGYVNRRYKKGGRNAGQKESGHEFMIPAHYVHHNTVQIMDDGVMRQIADSVKTQQAAGITDMNQILSGVRDLPVMHGRAHRSGSRFESVHGRIPYDQERASNMRQGLGDPDTGEMTVDGQVPESRIRPTAPSSPDPTILHETIRNTGFGQWLMNPRSGGNQHYANGGKGVRRLLEEHHGFDEEQVNRIFESARSSGSHRRIQDRIIHAIHEEENRDGVLPPWFEGQPMAHEHQMGVGDIIQPPQTPAQPAPVPIGPVRPPAPPPEQRIRPEPAPKRPFPRDPRVEEYFRTRMGSGINPNQQVYGSTETRQGGAGALSGLSELLSRLNNSDSMSDTLLRSEEYKNDFEKYIEEVQMEMAKTVIDDYAEVKKMSPDDPLDLAMLSSRIQRPTNDVISIYHTRGDWRNIAKSFNVSHEQVQLVKVALNG